jgi:hypothetical protein
MFTVLLKELLSDSRLPLRSASLCIRRSMAEGRRIGLATDQRVRHDFVRHRHAHAHHAFLCAGERRRLRADALQQRLHLGYSAGPMIVPDAAIVKDGVWRGVGDQIMPGQDPVTLL